MDKITPPFVGCAGSRRENERNKWTLQLTSQEGRFTEQMFGVLGDLECIAMSNRCHLPFLDIGKNHPTPTPTPPHASYTCCNLLCKVYFVWKKNPVMPSFTTPCPPQWCFLCFISIYLIFVIPVRHFLLLCYHFIFLSASRNLMLGKCSTPELYPRPFLNL